MKLRWSPEAADDLEEIFNYLLLHWPAYAQSTAKQIYREVQSLKRFPMTGRPTDKFGVRELVFDRLPYLCLYLVELDAITLLHIRHAARDRPEYLQ